MNNLPDGLNPEQRQAVQNTEGALRVIAGPGTGKTRTLTERYGHLVATLGIAPKNILCVTFTNRAANEMKRRVRAKLGDLDLGLICTFHAFCVQMLKEDIHVLNYPKNFIILDVEDQKQILLKVFADMGLGLRDTTIQRTLDEVLEARKLFATSYINDIYELDNEALRARALHATSRDEEIFLRYLYEQKKCFGCDFNDLINFAIYILERFPDVRQKWANRMQYVMVDEFQDVSERQYKIARILAEKHGNLFIVGDPDQTIYSWRGSHVRLFLDFPKKYPTAQTIALTANYRSTLQVLAAADALITHNIAHYPKTLVAVKASGARTLYYHAKNERGEAEWMAARISALHAEGIALGDVALLYRAHYLTRALEECLVDKGLPYRIFSGIEFYGRKEIKDVIAYLRMVTSGDDIAFLRTVNTPLRKIGKKKLDTLKEYAEAQNLSLYEALKENLSSPLFAGTQARQYVDAIECLRAHHTGMQLGDVLQSLLDRSGYEEFLRLQGDQERLDNIAELKRAVDAMGVDEDATLEDFLTRAALFTNLDGEEHRDTVKLMTIHAAKGMEFPYVFLCGMNEGVFPGHRVTTPDEMEEERRLAYVAMTRAMTQLYLSDSEGAANDGIFKYPSRFIFELGPEHLDYVVPLDPQLEADARAHIRRDEAALSLRRTAFSSGERVIHPVFGVGTIITVNASELCYTILFDALKTERSIQLGAALERT
ncbi:MAG: UvrD-helicase domain-containing protein [Azoarcus sp.]|jgi:DNA helicase-2/ATP-dependent DNA helicase PcrA|nr:UvrD-helicase domain-containing protein [Azoarcus sp.]